MSATQVNAPSGDTVQAIFENMNYGPAPEAGNVAQVGQLNGNRLGMDMVNVRFYFKVTWHGL